MCLLQIWAGNHYKRKLGDVPQYHGRYEWIALFALFAAWALCVYADQMLHGALAAWLMAACFLGCFCFYQGRIRHYLIPAIVFLMLAMIPGQPYRREYNWVLGACLIFTGLMDHFLLIRWMPAALNRPVATAQADQNNR